MAISASSQHHFPWKPLLTWCLLTWCFLSSDQSSTQASCPHHPAPGTQLLAGLPSPPFHLGSLFRCLPNGSSCAGLLAQFLSWEQTGGSGKVGPTQAGLGQLNHVNSRHLPGHQEKGNWVHPGEGRADGTEGCPCAAATLRASGKRQVPNGSLAS